MMSDETKCIYRGALAGCHAANCPAHALSGVLLAEPDEPWRSMEWPDVIALVEEAKPAVEPTPLPELETALDGVAMYVAHPTTEQKAALYDHARAALEDTFGSCIATDPVATAAHEYRDATGEIPGEDHGMFLDDEMYHPLNEIVATLADWWREGAAVDHELPAVDPLPEGAQLEGVGQTAAVNLGNGQWVRVQGSAFVLLTVDENTVVSDQAVQAAAYLRAVLSRAKDA